MGVSTNLVWLDSSEREVENKKAFENFKQTHGSKTGQSVSATPTERDGILYTLSCNGYGNCYLTFHS